MSFKAWTPTYWEPEQAFEGYRGLGLLIDPRTFTTGQTQGGSSANLVAKTSMPALSTEGGYNPGVSSQAASVPWLDQETFGVKNLYLAIGGAAVVAGGAFLVIRRKKK